MVQIDINDLRGGMKVEVDGQPYTVVSVQFVKPGKGQAFTRVKLKHLHTARVIERTFKSGEKVEEADVKEAQMRLLYTDSGGATFMDDASYEQITIDQEKLDDVKNWLRDDVIYSLVFYKGEPTTVEPPTFMEMQITESAPGIKGDTASGRVLKPAKTDTGAIIQVPIFIEQGEWIKVDTRTGEYVSRVNK
jgi:elongation factor P